MPQWTAAELSIKGLWAALVALVFAIVLILLAVQTVRLEGFKLWPIEAEGWKPKAVRLADEITLIRLEQGVAGEAAKAQRLEQEDQYRGISERIDDDAQDQLAEAAAAAERFIAARGVRPKAAGCPRGRAGAGAQDRDAPNPQGTSQAAELDATPDRRDFGVPEGYVIVPADDVRICTVNTIKAEAGRELAIELEKASADE